jgi:hypothetical protein
MDNQSGRLIDDDQVGVLIRGVQGNVLGSDLDGFGRRDRDEDPVSGAQGRPGLWKLTRRERSRGAGGTPGGPFNPDAPLTDESLDPRPGPSRRLGTAGEVNVQPAAFAPRLDLKFKKSCSFGGNSGNIPS